MKSNWNVIALLSFLFISAKAFASPALLTYQGRILFSSGAPLEYNNVSFLFEVLSPDGLCVLYREQKNGVNMTNSKGVFDVAIGTGTRLFPTSGVFTLGDVFDNTATLNCGDANNNISGTLPPAAQASRKLRVQFHDGVGWQLITPDTEIRSVPYAHFASSALKLGSYSAADFVKTISLPPAACSPGQVVFFDGAQFSCVVDAGGSGVVSDVVAGAGVSVSGTSTKTVAVTFGTTAGTVVQGNDSRLVGAFQTSTTLSGDLSGNLPNPTVAQIQGRPVSGSAPSNNQVLKWNGSAWAPSNDTVGTGTVTSVDMTVPSFLSVAGGPVTSAGSLSVSLNTQSARSVFAAPVGAAGTPSFRSLGILDIFSTVGGLSFLNTTPSCSAGRALVYVSASDRMECADLSIAWSQVTGKPTTLAGYGITDAGSVTSVGLSAPSLFSVSGSPVTSSGTISLGLASQSANLVFASPNGMAGTPGFRSLASADIPALDAAKISSGILPLSRGGTGSADGSITGSGALTFTAGGANQSITLSPSGTGATVLNGNVGIGTSTPTSHLSIVNGAATLHLAAGRNTSLGYGMRSNTNYDVVIDSGQSFIVNLDVDNNQAAFMNVVSGTGDSIFYASETGRVGVGTTSPLQKMHVENGNAVLTGTAPAYQLKETDTVDTNWQMGINGGSLRFATQNDALNSSSDKVTITQAGNVGIGTSAPGQKLTVAGTVESTAGGFKFPDGTTQTSAGAASLGATGYQRLPSGMIMQWGTLAGVALDQSFHTVTFPIAFPNAALNVQATIHRSATISGAVAPVVRSVTTTGAQIAGDYDTNTSTGDIQWFAIGY